MDKRHFSTRLIRVPTVCPVCDEESLHQIDIAQTASALLCDTPVTLSAQCHAGDWPASTEELDQIREYLRELLPTIPVRSPGHPGPVDVDPPAVSGAVKG